MWAGRGRAVGPRVRPRADPSSLPLHTPPPHWAEQQSGRHGDHEKVLALVKRTELGRKLYVELIAWNRCFVVTSLSMLIFLNSTFVFWFVFYLIEL